MGAPGQGGISRLGTRANPLSFGSVGSGTDSLSFTHNLNRVPLELQISDLNLNRLDNSFLVTVVDSNQIRVVNQAATPQDVLIRVTWEDLSAHFGEQISSADPRLVFS